MRTNISLEEFNIFVDFLESLCCLGFISAEQIDIVWEKRPRLTINRLGNFEFSEPQEIYGVTVVIYDDADIIASKIVGQRKFFIVS